MDTSGPMVPGFVWTPELWAARAETATIGNEATAVPSPIAPPIQRQPEVAAAVSPEMDTAVPPTTPSIPPAVAPSGAGAPIPAQPVTTAATSPPPSLTIQRHTEEPERPSGQLAPAEAVSSPAEAGVPVSEPAVSATPPSASTAPPPALPPVVAPVAPPSLLGRIGQRLGRLVSRPQPAITPPAASTPPAPQPATTPAAAPVQRQPAKSESDLLSTTAVHTTAPAMPVQDQPETAAGGTAVSPAAAPRPSETPVVTAPAPPGSVPVAPAATPTLVQRQPETPAMPAAAAPGSGPTPQTPSPIPVQRQPETLATPPVIAPMPGLAVPTTPTPTSAQRQPETTTPAVLNADVVPSTTATGSAPVVPTTPVSSIPPAVPTTPITGAPPIQRQLAASETPAPLAGLIASTPVPSPVPLPGTLAASASLPPQPIVAQPAVPAVVQPAMAQPPAVQRQPEAAPPTEEDRNWRRLETIMRRHKEQEAAEAANVETGTPGLEPPPTAPFSEPPLPSFARPQPAAKPAPGVVSRQPAAPPREAPMVAVARGRGPVKGETAVSPDTTLSPPTLPVEPTPTETAVAPPTPPSPAAPHVWRSEADDDTLLATLPEPGLSGVKEIEPVAGEGPEGSSPLQTVWPVQTVQRVEAPATTPPVLPASPFPAATEPPVRPPTPQDFWVEERLATVPPGMPTDSSVPLLRPRRPRPSRLAAAGADTSVLMAEMGGTAMPPTIQRQPESEVGLVPTEIGALPPDLWTLIGQPSPAIAATETQAQPGQQTVMAKRDGEGTTATFPASVQTVTPVPDVPAITAPTPDLSDYIQLEEGSEASSPAVAPGEGGEVTEGKKEGEEIDINELARQVYAHIRNQLTIDRERERGRLIHKW